MCVIADQGFPCECGSLELAAAPSESGRVLLCPVCARAYLGPNAPIDWRALERELGQRDADRFAMGWIRAGVPIAQRRELELGAGGRFRAPELARAALGLVLAVVMLLTVARAVLS